MSNILPLNKIIPLAHTLATREAHRPDDVDDLVQVGLFAYHKAEERYLRLGLTVDKPWSLARTTLQRAVRGYYIQQHEWEGDPLRRQAADRSVGKDLGIDQVGLAYEMEFMVARHPMFVVGLDGRMTNDEQPELMEFDDYFRALEKSCGLIARRIVENLVLPSGECCGRILEEVRRKECEQAKFAGQRMRRNQPRGVKEHIRVSHRLVREALGLSLSEWSRNMKVIREFTRTWISQ